MLRRLHRSIMGSAQAATFAVCCTLLSTFPLVGWTSPASAAQPNIVVLLADDMNADDLPYMPKTLARLAQQGVQFDAYFVNVSQCDPSRATFLTGRYTQNTRVLTNSYSSFVDGGNERDNLATRLKSAGYRTALIGKYLNSSPKAMPAGYVHPGWSYWFALSGGDFYGEYNYRINENGTTRSYGSNVADYGTDVFRSHAITFIKKAIADHVPYFCFLSFTAPHAPSTPAVRHQSLFLSTPLPDRPSRNEADVSDKPSYIQTQPLLAASKIASLTQAYRKRLRSLQAADEAIDAVFTAMGKGNLSNTYVIFASDNGYLYGEHREIGKAGPYEEMIHQPLLVRGPGVAHGLRVSALVGNADLMPTILGWAGVPVPSYVDGRSFQGYLTQHVPTTWRSAYPLREASAYTQQPFPKFMGFRTGRYSYILYQNGEQEFYDMLNDPYQLTNIATQIPPDVLAGYAAVATKLAACKGAACRTLESDPLLPQ